MNTINKSEAFVRHVEYVICHFRSTFISRPECLEGLRKGLRRSCNAEYFVKVYGDSPDVAARAASNYMFAARRLLDAICTAEKAHKYVNPIEIAGETAAVIAYVQEAAQAIGK